ncbi:transposase [Acaryochloris sp. IP29b_bin.137]|uniref:transposase n=1 Tax=Acaryochloris sp. IP29b_bin.137 TaxID=2969217 RepID=UPI00263600E3|nr:transposase [Acaryochloris sp. IP29b_bin.137]
MPDLSDYDSPWKEALERYFPQALEFLFSLIHTEIDWEQGWEFLDKELQQVVRDAELGRRLVDKLVKVWRQDGSETWVLLHLEVQGSYEANFAERMFVYHYRLRDRYNLPVVTLAILADKRVSWRPAGYSNSLWGCRVSLDFPIVKLLDYESQLSELEQSSNPFSVIVVAHLQAQATDEDMEDRLKWKLKIVKGLYEQGYDREDILELFRFIDWVMTLPAALENQFDDELSAFEEEREMPYVTSVERRAALRTKQSSIIDALEVRFGAVPDEITDQVAQLHDAEQLQALFKDAILIESIDAFQKLLDENVSAR